MSAARCGEGLRIVLDVERMCLHLENGGGPAFEVRKVFARPIYSCEAAVERALEVIDHV